MADIVFSDERVQIADSMLWQIYCVLKLEVRHGLVGYGRYSVC